MRTDTSGPPTDRLRPRLAQRTAPTEDTLRAAGADLIELPADPAHPDGVFVEDTAVVLDEVAIVTRPKPLSHGAVNWARSKGRSFHFALSGVSRPMHGWRVAMSSV